jgi:hypothetical protein
MKNVLQNQKDIVSLHHQTNNKKIKTMKNLIDTIKEEVKNQMGYENCGVNSMLVVTITQKKKFEVLTSSELEQGIDPDSLMKFSFEGTTYFFVKQ